MYVLTVILLMFVFPIASVLMEMFLFKTGLGTMFLIGKWFVFWGVGTRFFSAGLRQSLNPKFTAEEIFEIKSSEPLVVVQELGFANLSMGLLGIVTIFNANWIVPSAIAGGLFYGLAGIKHLTRKRRNLIENVATFSDMFMFLVLLMYIIEVIFHGSIL
ncbi:MAG: DUF6790 family protein [Candidatus Kryptoniota bacterium]